MYTIGTNDVTSDILILESTYVNMAQTLQGLSDMGAGTHHTSFHGSQPCTKTLALPKTRYVFGLLNHIL